MAYGSRNPWDTLWIHLVDMFMDWLLPSRKGGRRSH